MLAVTFACTAVQANLVPPAGEGNRGQTQYWLAKREKNEAGSLKRPQVNSFLVQDTYHCSYGPEDFRGCLPEALTQKDRPANSRVTKKDRGQSCKRGCLQQFTISKLYDYSEVAQLSMKHSEHTDKAGNVAHGSSLAAQGIRELHAPHVSDKMRDWVTIKVNDRCTTQQILKQHAKAVEARIAAGNSDRDCFLTGQDIRNIEQKLAKGTWKLHENEAQSVRLFYQQHSDFMFIYVEERSADSEQLQAAQKFVMGWMTSFMINNLLKFGKNCVVLLDATFGTNHLKMPLYTGIVMDNFGNGVPGFMTLCQGTSQPDISQWLTALLQRVRKEDPEWMCSCVMVDDAIAEINAIK